MKLLKREDNKLEQYKVTPEESELIKQMIRFKYDHVILIDDNGVICLMVHTNDSNNQLLYNGISRNTKEIMTLVRQELNIDEQESIVIRVFCCNGAEVEGYYETSTNSYIVSAFDVSGELIMNTNTYIAKFYVA